MGNKWVKESTWKEFRDSGLFWFMNSILHVFGWAIMLDMDEDGNISNARPAKVKFRGFPQDINDKGYEKVTNYLNNNMSELLEAFDDEE